MNKKDIFLLGLLIILGLLCLPSVLAAFNFTGVVYNSTGSVINVTNVSLYIYLQPSLNPTLILSVLSNGSGNFNMTINNTYCSDAYSFKPVLRKFSGTGVDVNFTGQTLPDLPYNEFSTLSSVNFYLKPAINLNITAVNATGSPVYFNYMVKDTRLGFPVSTNFDSGMVLDVNVSFPSDRNYSIMLFPNQSFPIGYELTNLSLNDTYQTSNVNHIDIKFNTSNTLRRVSGNITFNNATNFQNLTVISYLLESGSDMVSLDRPLPYNMSAWNGGTDVFNNNTGLYNITLPGATMGIKILLFATAVKGGVYYGSFRNISLTDASTEVGSFNLDLKPLAGNLSTISLPSSGGGANVAVVTKQVHFQLLSNGSNLSSGNMDTTVNYTSFCTNCSSFKMMSNINSSGVYLPLLNASVKEVNVYTSNAAPKKTSFAASDLSTGTVSINLTQFTPGEIDSADAIASSNLEIGMYKSDSTCSVPYPNASCSLLDPTRFDVFSPLTVVMGGGKIDFMMRMKSNNITVKYINVDLMASGPPDALFDSSANSSSSGADLDAAWRFGSMGPEIYDRVLIGIPYASNVDTTAPISILLNHLYDQDWNPIWNSTNSPNAENYSTVANGDYSTFSSSWFNASLGGVRCNLTNPLADCYINTTNRMIWISIPHFSGIGPLVNTFSAGNVSMNTTLTQIPCTYNCTVYINVTNSNYTLVTSLHNITINSSVSISNVMNFSIFRYNNSDWLLNGTNNTVHWDYNLTLYNGSAVTVHQYRVNITKINSSSTLWNFTYNISGFDTLLKLQLNLTCVENWTYTSWTTCTDSQQIRTATDASNCGTTDNRSALLQGCTSSSSSSSSGGGSAGTSGGVPSGVTGQFEQKTWTSINAGETATVPVANGEIGVTEVTFGVSKTALGVWLKVEKKDSLPNEVKSFGNKAYKYFEIQKSPSLKDSITITPRIAFKVKKSWLNDHKLSKENIALFRYVNSKWAELKTTVGNDDVTYIHYSAETPGFSYFIIGEKAVVTAPAAEEKPVEKPATTPTAPIEEAKAVALEVIPGKTLIWPWIVVGVIIVAVILALIWNRRPKKKRF